jgi:hypothetical protein
LPSAKRRIGIEETIGQQSDVERAPKMSELGRIFLLENEFYSVTY